MKNTRILFLTGLMAALTACSTALPNGLPQVKNMRAENTQGRELNLSLELSDPDRDPLKCKVNWGDGSASEDVTCSSLTELVQKHTYAKIGSYQVTLEVSDGKDTVTQSLSVLVSDLRNPPTISEFKQKPGPDALNAEITFMVDDADAADSLSCTLDWGDGTIEAAFSCAKGVSIPRPHTYARGGDYAVLLTVSDGKSVTSRTLGVIVQGYGPKIALVQKPTVTEPFKNKPYAVGVDLKLSDLDTVTQPSPYVCQVNWGDNTGFKPVACKDTLPEAPLEYDYTRPGDYAVLFEINDLNGKPIVSKTLGVKVLALPVNNRPEIVDLYQLASNPGDLAASIQIKLEDLDGDALKCSLDWGDRSPLESFDCPRATAFSKAHPYAKEGDYAVLLRVEDSKGGVITRTLGVKVSSLPIPINYPPNISMLQVPVPDSILTPYLVRVRVNIAEQNAGDTLTCRVNWGDNTGFKPVVPCPKNGDFVLDYNYDRPGDYAVLLEVDDGTHKVSKTLGVTIRGYMALTGSRDGTSRLWDSNNGNLFNTLNGHAGGVYAAVFSPDGKTVLTGGEDGKAKLWNSISGQLLNTYTFRQAENGIYPVYAVAFSPNGQKIAMAGAGGISEIRATSSGSILQAWQSDSHGLINCPYVYISNPLGYKCRLTNSIEFNPGGDKILTGGSDGLGQEWDSENVGNPAIYVTSEGNLLGFPTYSPDGTKVAASSSNVDVSSNDYGSGNAYVPYRDFTAIFDTSTKQLISKLGRKEVNINDVYGAPKFSPDGQNIAAPYNVLASDLLTPFYGARIWNVSSGQLLTTLGQHSQIVTRVAFNKQGTKLITGSEDNTAKIWDITSTNLLVTLQGHTGGITAVMFSPVRY